MPELIEVELYRRAAEAVVGQPVREVRTPDPTFVRHGAGPALRTELVDRTVLRHTRIGKLMVTQFSGDGPSLVEVGWRFGMTGRLIVGSNAPIAELEYASGRDDPAWDRFAIEFGDGTVMRVNDPRRLGSIELSPDRTRLGADAATIRATALDTALATSVAPIKAALLDQSRVAGLGNLLVDESLWRAGVDPARATRSLTVAERSALATTIRATVRLLTRRGGSHRGDLMEHRHRGGHCPRCGAELLRRTIGGRTTYSCPVDQR